MIVGSLTGMIKLMTSIGGSVTLLQADHCYQLNDKVETNVDGRCFELSSVRLPSVGDYSSA